MGIFSDVLLTVDFDRTLTGPDSQIPQRNLEAIRYFIDNGGAFTVNTGRSLPMTKVFRDIVPVSAPLLLYNGSAAYDTLNKYGVDLVERAREQKLDPVIGRDAEIRNIVRILSRKSKNNPVLIGEPGVGKTAVVEGLAQRIVRGDVPQGLKDKKVFSLDMGALVAGAKYRGQCQQKDPADHVSDH